MLDENNWRCTLCRIKNGNEFVVCRSCETPNPNASAEQLAKHKADEAKKKADAAAAKPVGFTMPSAGGAGFAFGTKSTGTAFAFGSKPAAATADGAAAAPASGDKPASTGFKFGASAPGKGFAFGSSAVKASSVADAAAPAAADAAAVAAAAAETDEKTVTKSVAAADPVAPAAAAAAPAPAPAAKKKESTAVRRPAPTADASDAAADGKRSSLAIPTRVGDDGAAAKAAKAADTAAAKFAAALKKNKGIPMVIGSGDMSQLGLGTAVRERKFPAIVKALEGEDIAAVAAGALHNLVLTKSGKIFSWGCNDDGAIGRETKVDATEMTPAPVAGLVGVKITQISCGASHSLALDADGVAYSWGAYRDASGLVGFDKGAMVQSVPVALRFPPVSGRAITIAQIAAAESHSLALDTEGRVWYWGDVYIGRRQSDRLKRDRLSPRVVSFPPKPKRGSKAAAEADLKDWNIKAVFCGGYTSFAVAESGNVWVWGPNNYSQCGIKRPSEDEDDISVTVPTIIPFFAENKLKVRSVASAAQFSVVLTEDARVFTFGRTADSRLGHGDFDYKKEFEICTPMEVKTLNPVFLSSDASWTQPAPHVTTEMNTAVTTKMPDRVVAISVAEAHALAYTSAGRAFGWGSGDLGQLGYGEETVVPAPYWIRSMQLTTTARRVVGVAAGSQHSLILAKDV